MKAPLIEKEANTKSTDETLPTDLDDKIEQVKKQLEEKKKKSMNAWGETGDKKSFGLIGFAKFTAPRLWRGDFFNKFLVVLNFVLILANKGANVVVPIVLKYAVDAITCVKGVSECPTPQHTYVLIAAYALVKFAADFLNYIREIPYARMSANAEISIAHDVYDHVQR